MKKLAIIITVFLPLDMLLFLFDDLLYIKNLHFSKDWLNLVVVILFLLCVTHLFRTPWIDLPILDAVKFYTRYKYGLWSSCKWYILNHARKHQIWTSSSVVLIRLPLKNVHDHFPLNLLQYTFSAWCFISYKDNVSEWVIRGRAWDLRSNDN